MNKEGQSDKSSEPSLPASEPVINPNRPKFRINPMLEEAPGGIETIQKVFNALDNQMSKQQEKVQTNLLSRARRAISRIVRRS